MVPIAVSESLSDPPPGWRWELLTDVADLATGHTPDRKRPDYWDGGIPWINLTEIRRLDGQVATETELTVSSEGVRHSSAVLLPEGTVCFSRTASIGFVTIMGRKMTTSQDFVNWVCGDRLEPRYLMRALLASRERLRALSSGSTHKTIYMRVAERFRVLLPPMEEQRRIATVLERADGVCAKRRDAVALLGTLSEAVFFDMFGEPVSNPKAWPTVPIGDLVERFEAGKSVDTNDGDRLTARNWVIKVSAITSGQFLPDESKPIPPSYEPPAAHFVRSGDLLFSRANTEALVGASALVESQPSARVLSDKIWRFVWKNDAAVVPAFMWQLLQAPRVRQAIGSLATGTSGSMKNISQAKLMTLKIPLPPLAEQREFERRYERARTLMSDGRLAARHADSLFGSLQQRAFRGDL